ncbi:tripartite tricarboxylate transporter substrate binding protein [Ottowia sp. VDI28]|uniref:tripartite tricarboxylate transporter substrate binding protein n=1 Tax=Ottowia sp. VDI28 TaxID=3133968 RepID=UPI003C2C835B
MSINRKASIAGIFEYTFFVGPTHQESIVPFVTKVNVDASKDLVPVAAIVRFQNYLLVKADSPFNSIGEFVAYACQHPKRLTYGSSGTATGPHMAGEMLMQRTGIELIHVPYKGAAPALQAALSGEVDAIFDPGVGFGHVSSGRLKMISVASGQRSALFPAVPTTVEAGLADVRMDMLTGIWAPRKTPADVIQRMANAIEKVTATSDFQSKMGSMGAQALYMNPVSFSKFIDDETRVLSRLIKERNITVD